MTLELVMEKERLIRNNIKGEGKGLRKGRRKVVIENDNEE